MLSAMSDRESVGSNLRKITLYHGYGQVLLYQFIILAIDQRLTALMLDAA